ncbi:hydrophobic surface binding protein A-domain-containing protein [Mycena galopus ATCC 62051]|nr:hydrophobic surface binding protein A-domain-containing protein [Mycena galopus ATCC 62051]
MVQLSHLLLSVCLVAASLANPLKRTVHKVEADIQNIGAGATTLSNDVGGYPASGLTGAVAIHADIQGLTATVNNGANDVKATGPLNETDATTILAETAALTSFFREILEALGAQAPSWTNIPGGQALVLSDLKSYKASTIRFLDAMIAAVPTDLVAQTTTIKTQLVEAFNSAINAYSS